jgi:hypothetical protein
MVSASRGLVMASRVIVLRAMASASRGLVMENRATDLRVPRAMVNASRGAVTASQMTASVSRGLATVSPAIGLRETVSVSRGLVTGSPVTDQRVPAVTVRSEMASVSRGLAMGSRVIVHSVTPGLRVRVATALSAIMTPIL